MASATAVLYSVRSFDGRVIPAGAVGGAIRSIIKHVGLAAAALATVGVLGLVATLGAAFIVNRSVDSNPRIHATRPIGPASLGWVKPEPGRARHADIDAAFATKWAQVAVSIGLPIRPIDVPQAVAKNAAAKAPSPVEVATLDPPARVAAIPLPRPHPEEMERLPAKLSAAPPKVAVALPPPPAAKPVPPPEMHAKPPVLAEADRRTALYDIAGHTVYMPNGEKLEAHSGLGDKLDDPRFTKVRMRGPTPPNVYELSLREQLFHGVRAIRLTPVDENRMYGRDGMLAHTYMLGPNGDSNGCVSFKNYRKFLTAYLNGEVDRMVVVGSLGKTPWRTAVAQQSHVRRYAANN